MQNITRTLAVLLTTATIVGCGSFQSTDLGWSGHAETGKASYYASKHHLKKTASGEIYRQELNTAAHRTLPFGNRVKVTNISNGKSVIVRINDRGPFVRGRIIDLSRAAFSSIANLSAGVISVKMEVVK